jgi:hypothetical protein
MFPGCFVNESKLFVRKLYIIITLLANRQPRMTGKSEVALNTFVLKSVTNQNIKIKIKECCFPKKSHDLSFTDYRIRLNTAQPQVRSYIEVLTVLRCTEVLVHSTP